METPDKAATCPKCKTTRTFYDGWNCPTEGCDDSEISDKRAIPAPEAIAKSRKMLDEASPQLFATLDPDNSEEVKLSPASTGCSNALTVKRHKL
jgi:hypothetical protein